MSENTKIPDAIYQKLQELQKRFHHVESLMEHGKIQEGRDLEKELLPLRQEIATAVLPLITALVDADLLWAWISIPSTADYKGGARDEAIVSFNRTDILSRYQRESM